MVGDQLGIHQLACEVQMSAWGKRGSESTVAMLAQQQKDYVIDEQAAYAEFWMGAHPRHPSTLINVLGEKMKLGDWISQNPLCLGKQVVDNFGTNLPYLFKVLSINSALSIQAHPTKEHAAILHKEFPDVYPDPNHKPEIAIALTKFEGLCAFRQVEEILSYIKELQELLVIVGQEAVDMLITAEKASEKHNKKAYVHKALKRCFTALMECDPRIVKEQLAKLVERLEECHSNGEDTTPYLGRLFLRTHRQYPGDVGCFVIYFLNHIKLEPFESIYFEPNVPHAYLCGDIVECMASSDNVVRAGLTPKFKDVKTLCEMLDYNPRTVDETKFLSVDDADDPFLSVFDPPCEDFSVRRMLLPAGHDSYRPKPVGGPSILLTLSGSSQVTCQNKTILLERGCVIFISSGEQLEIDKVNSNEDLLMFQAYC